MSSSSELSWFKSSYSGTEGDNCIEVALTARAIHIRDSKDTARPAFSVAPQAWVQFVEHTATS
ncbi:hypothetical protein SLNWT_2379 [Streptomyces albus]|uniref:DUF397 domain-containing protein n=1 Tax=Streptomyces albus (strain ATCC 21838 / DSM 41398 / FERM P-419 / JCM 4703 / NBRC 107858) TaxID=1081613 RepID=A0A0B5EU36_STRA4|nr:hypothetical protein SLNWT_2379 [Streptomyces albus]AOU77068.1 hypothetical protein SLNHY_2377 [Streptomyces albus]AYN32846.1 DUF397 domain-containing protein [Streptomyces albus]